MIYCMHSLVFYLLSRLDVSPLFNSGQAAPFLLKSIMMRNLFLLALFFCGVDAFIGRSAAPIAVQVQSSVPQVVVEKAIAPSMLVDRRKNASASTSTTLFAKKKQDNVPEYGKGALDPLRWISPLNPYMLFVYMFAFIIAVPSLKEAGIL